MARKKLQTFQIQAHVTVWAGVSIRAENLSEAVQIAGELTGDDFVECKEECVDFIETEVTSIFKE